MAKYPNTPMLKNTPGGINVLIPPFCILLYKLQFIDRKWFMATSVSNFINNIFEGIHKTKCKYGHDDKKYKTCGIKYKYCDCFHECKSIKDHLIE